MPTLSPGITASLVLAPGESYTISTTGSATVKGIYGAPSTTTTLTANFAKFGPYGVPAKLDIACASGVASYTLDQFEGVPANIKTDTSGAAALVGADGAIPLADIPLEGTTAAKTDKVNAVLSASGNRAISTNTEIDDSIVVASGTSLEIRASTVVKLADGTNKLMISNFAATQPWTAIANNAVVWSGSDVVIGFTGHNCVVSDYIHLDNATIANMNHSAFKGVMQVREVIDANTIVCSLNRRPNIGTAVPATGWQVRKADKDLSITVLGDLDYNYAGNLTAGGQDRMQIRLCSVANCRVSAKGKNGFKYSLLVAGSRGGIYSGQAHLTQATTGSDIIKVYGPSCGDIVENVFGYPGDDAVSFQTREPAAYAVYMPCFGDVIGARIRNVVVDSTVLEVSGVRAYASLYEYMDVDVDGVHGSVAGPAVIAMAGADFPGAEMSSFSVNNVTAKARLGVQIGLGPAMQFGSVKLSNIKHNYRVGAGSIEVKSSMTIRNLVIDRYVSNLSTLASPSSPGAGTGTGYLVNNAAGYPIGARVLALDTGTGTILAGDTVSDAVGNAYAVESFTGGVLTIARPGLLAALADNATIGISNTTNHIVLGNCIIHNMIVTGAQQTGARGNNRFIATATGMTLGRLTVRESSLMCDRVVNLASGLANTPVINLEDNYLDVIRGVYASGNCEVIATGNVLKDATGGIATQISGTVNLSHAVNQLGGTSVLTTGTVTASAM